MRNGNKFLPLTDKQFYHLDNIDYATLAQLAEQDPCKVPVAGAIPAGGSNGTVPEWLKGTRCKRVGVCLRQFESVPFHKSLEKPYIVKLGRVAQFGRARALQA